jgi:branched-chain amino acid transport system ATP-binding protein
MLEVDGIDVHYGPVQALFGVSLRVDEAEMVALLGANGAGKTTTLRTISGLIPPTRGAVRIDGRDIAGIPAQKVVRLGVAHLPEGRELFPELTVLENLRLGYWSRRKDKRGFDAKLEHVFHLFPRMQERAGQAAGTLSGGEQQMLAVGRALMSGPRLLLVDEVSLGLAPIVVSSLFAALEEVNRQGTAILLVEQFVHLALKHTSRAYVLGKGEVVIEGKSKDLLASPELMAAYLGEMEDEETPAEPEPEVIDLAANPQPEAVPEPEAEPQPEPIQAATESAVEPEVPPAPAKPARKRAPRAKVAVAADGAAPPEAPAKKRTKKVPPSS